jgi:hypothetical protein
VTDVKIAELEPYLSGVDWPASRTELVQCATERGATDRLRNSLSQLPDMSYESTRDVEEELARVPA